MAQSLSLHFPSLPRALQEALEHQLVIVNESKKIKRNKAAFQRLAQVASESVDDTINYYKIMEPYFPHGVPQDLDFTFQHIVNSSKCLRHFICQVAARNSFTAFLFSRSDAREIEMHQESLATAQCLVKIVLNAYVKRLGPKLSAGTLAALGQRLDAAGIPAVETK